MTVLDANETRSPEKLLLRALAVSLVLHLVLYSTWWVGQKQGWLRDLAMPRWMQVITQILAPVAPKKLLNAPLPRTQLAFVEIDPSLATPEPPSAPKYIGAKNTLAANKEIKVPSENPNIEGRKQDFLKTTQFAKPTEPKPAPQPTPPQEQPKPKTEGPKKTEQPGDLAMLRPSDKANDGKTDKDSDQSEAQPEPVHQRPRTLAEARAKSGTHGEPTQQLGGVGRIQANASLDVKGSLVGDYLQEMVAAVDSRWNDLLKDRTVSDYGKVVLKFRLHPDGRVTDFKLMKNEVSAFAEALCERAIQDPAPYRKWPPDMLRELGDSVQGDGYEIIFTFYYEM